MFSWLSHNQKKHLLAFWAFLQTKMTDFLALWYTSSQGVPPPPPPQPLPGSYLFELFKFHDFFHDLFKFFTTLGLDVTFKIFQNFPCFTPVQTTLPTPHPPLHQPVPHSGPCCLPGNLLVCPVQLNILRNLFVFVLYISYEMIMIMIMIMCNEQCCKNKFHIVTS